MRRSLALGAGAMLAGATFVAATPPADPAFVREAGRCAMRGECGSKGAFGGQIPCPDNDLAETSTDPIYLATLKQICGEDFSTTTCCTLDQLTTLSTSLAQAEPLIATCPACKNNFLQYYCHFTCSPDQSQFLTVTSTQVLRNNKTGVKEVEVNVASNFGGGFFDSCKDVKFGATNGYAMDLLGGGARNWLAFLRYMGQERALGSPFQINYPDALPDDPPAKPNNTTIVPMDFTPLVCSSSELNARCACLDCPDVCTTLPYLPTPAERDATRCHVGKMSCVSFSIVIIHAILVVAFFTNALGMWAYGKQKKGQLSAATLVRIVQWPSWPQFRNRNNYDRVPMEDPLLSVDEDATPISPTNIRNGVQRSNSNPRVPPSHIGAGSTQQAHDGESMNSRRKPPSGASSARDRSSSLLGHSPSQTSSEQTPNPFLQPRTYPLNTYISNFFYRLGLVCARKPFLTLAVGLAVCGVANIGWSRFSVEKDPVRLWVAKGSESERAKEDFDNAFGPFYRTEQIFVSVAPEARQFERDGQLVIDARAEATRWEPVDAPVLNWERLQWWASVEEEIRQLASPSGLTLKDVCFAPATNPETPDNADPCVVQSLMGYLGNSLEAIDADTWASTLDSCANTPASCLPPFGQPLNPKLALGGVPPGEDEGTVKASEARAIVVTYVVNNSLDKKVIARAEEWEGTLRRYLDGLSNPASPPRRDLGLQITYSTGISLEAELNKSTNTDVPIVVLSYLIMFLYVSINLGSSGVGLLKIVARGLVQLAHGAVQLAKRLTFSSAGRSRSDSVTLSLSGSTTAMGAFFRRQVLVDSKFLLGLWGICIVLLSVSTSVAIFSAAGVKVTLIIAEVIPFLVLAIGVDNVFILSHELDQQNARAYATAARAIGGPLFSATANDEEEDPVDGLPPADERVARALGRIGPSILLSACCETLAFALGAIVGMPAVRNFAIYAAGAVLINAILQVTIFVSAMAIDLRRVEANRIDCFPCLKLPPASSLELGATVAEGFLARVIRVFYAPALLKKPVKYLVVATFTGFFVLSWVGARHIELGLDQRLALPSDSYLVNYFNALDTFLDVGPPVYFVQKEVNPTIRATQQKICGRFSTCQSLSVANVLEAERKRPGASFIAEPPAVWLDDFFQWLNPLLEDCCRVRRRDPTVFCGPDDPEMACRPCYEDHDPAWNITMDGLPEGIDFMRYLEHWLVSPTDESCPLGGKAPYSSALRIENEQVEASHFRTYHTPLKTQADFINAMQSAQRVARDLSKRSGGTVFPYSLFYVFFDQYSHIVSITREVLTLALGAVFLVTSLLLGSWRTGLVVLFTVFLSVMNVLGMMGAWGISLNAISLVNLVISVGIAVEFCSHIARAFMGDRKSVV